MPTLGRNLKRLTESHGLPAVLDQLGDALRARKIPESEVSFRELAQSFLGDDWPVKLGRYSARTLEAGDAVDASAFSAISGNILIDRVRDQFNSPEFIASALVETIPVTNGNLDTQREPWLSDVIPENPGALGGSDYVVEAGMPFPKTDFRANYFALAKPEKRSLGCVVTWEMLFSDRTRQALSAAGSVGKTLGLSREERILKVMFGLAGNFTASLGGGPETAYNTYYTSGGPYVNQIGTNPIDDWDSINAIEQVFANMLDPVTGKPIDVTPTALIVMPAKYYNAKIALNAPNIRQSYGTVPSGAGATTDIAAYAPNPLENNYPIYKSKYAYQLVLASVSGVAATAREFAVLADTKRAFYYREVRPLTVMQAPPGNLYEFQNDAAVAIKAIEFGVAGTQSPWHSVLSRNA
jgi:hypothetical protein